MTKSMYVVIVGDIDVLLCIGEEIDNDGGGGGC